MPKLSAQLFWPKSKDVTPPQIGLNPGNDRTVFTTRRLERSASGLVHQPVQIRRKPSSESAPILNCIHRGVGLVRLAAAWRQVRMPPLSNRR
jgi:hypothetical protein